MSKNTKLCFLISGAMYGGAETVVFELVRGLGKTEPICIVFRKHTLYYRLKTAGFKVYFLDESKYNTINLILKIRRILIEKNIGIIHSHCIKESIIAGLATIATKVRNVATIHGHDEFSAQRQLPRIYNWLKHEIQHIMFSQKYDALVFVSKNLANAYARFGIRKKQIVVKNGILKYQKAPTKNSNILRKNLGFDQNSFVVGVVGRMSRVKNQQYIIDILKQNPEKLKHIEFVFIGEGTFMSTLKRQTEHIPNITFLGFHSDILPIFSELDLLVNVSLKEGNPIVLLEAFMLKVPILASNVPGNNELIKHNYNGLLFDLNDQEDFINKLILMSDDVSLRQSLALNGFSTYEKEYTVDIMVRNYWKLYCRIFRKDAI